MIKSASSSTIALILTVFAISTIITSLIPLGTTTTKDVYAQTGSMATLPNIASNIRSKHSSRSEAPKE